jgi:hypothetical protein
VNAFSTIILTALRVLKDPLLSPFNLKAIAAKTPPIAHTLIIHSGNAQTSILVKLTNSKSAHSLKINAAQAKI